MPMNKLQYWHVSFWVLHGDTDLSRLVTKRYTYDPDESEIDSLREVLDKVERYANKRPITHLRVTLRALTLDE